jgi:pimeloyl-ACP methyl ester carboxylesterase
VTVDLAVRDSGEGVPLVLLHAFPLRAAMWDAVRPRGARVLAPDQRGFGGSPLGADEPSLDRCADDVVALLDHLGLDRVVLGGSSMGGYVAMALARRAPERLRGLVLVGTKAGADPDAGRAGRLAMAGRLDAGDRAPLRETVVPALTGQTSAAERPDAVERVRALAEEADLRAAAWAQRAMAARPDSADVLRGLDVPALVVVGEEDVLSPPPEARAMADALPDARLVVLPRTGHLLAVETPEPLVAVLEDFLTGL